MTTFLRRISCSRLTSDPDQSSEEVALAGRSLFRASVVTNRWITTAFLGAGIALLTLVVWPSLAAKLEMVWDKLPTSAAVRWTAAGCS